MRSEPDQVPDLISPHLDNLIKVKNLFTFLLSKLISEETQVSEQKIHRRQKTTRRKNYLS